MASKAGSLVRRLPPLPTLGDILRMYGIKAKKSLSQNFIMDPRILKKFADTAGELNNKYVIEVGPGPGGITRALLEAGAYQVHVIEKDARFLPSLHLLQEAAGEGKLHISIGDCLHYNPEGIFPSSVSKDWESPEPPNLVFVGNLPFNVATPLLIQLLASMPSRTNLYSYGRVPAVLTFQHEVAVRMAAPHGDPERSRLSVITQNYAEIDYVYNLPGGAFVPPPQVQVSIVRLTPLREPYISGLPFSFINKIVTAIFCGKQKQIKNSIANNLFPYRIREEMSLKLLKMAGVHSDQRAIDLSMAEIGNICYAYKNICDEQAQSSKENPLERYKGETLSQQLMEDEVKRVVNNSTSQSSMTKFDIRL